MSIIIRKIQVSGDWIKEQLIETGVRRSSELEVSIELTDYSKKERKILVDVDPNYYKSTVWLSEKITESNKEVYFKATTNDHKVAVRQFLDFYEKMQELTEKTKQERLSFEQKFVQENPDYFYSETYKGATNTNCITDKELREATRTWADNKGKLKEEEEKAKKEAEKAEMAKWALENGSDLLKARIEGGFDWLSLAEDEWLKNNMPASFQYSYIYSHTDTSAPDLEEIKIYKELKGKYPDAILTTAKIANPDYDEDDEETDEPEYLYVRVVQITISCPTRSWTLIREIN